ncbi:hypothetical protein FPT12_03290 [Pseudomonas sp. H3(2019)]|nr:hypothetical protein FPT12_03290 [Pseudomonas sp. H3(2019)]
MQASRLPPTISKRRSKNWTAIYKHSSNSNELLASFQFRDIRPKAASEIIDVGEASLLPMQKVVAAATVQRV